MLISVIIPVFNSSESLERCLRAVRTSSYRSFELIVVDDGSTDGSPEIAQEYADQILQVSGGPRGPAHARNLGAHAALGEVLFFIDADVQIGSDALQKVASVFGDGMSAAAVFGSYDDSPSEGGFLSQYKNLFHHFVHQQARNEASTFWAGCGAVRREVFLEIEGFDSGCYTRPSIEDIELGNRLTSAGHRILLDKSIQVKHLKRWTLGGLLRSDVLDRAIPWTELALRKGDLPNDLNLQFSQRLSAVLLGLTILYLGVVAFLYNPLLLPLLVLLVGFTIMVLGHYRWFEGPLFCAYDRRAEIGWIGLVASLVGLLFLHGDWTPILPMAPIVMVLAARRWLPDFNGARKRAASLGIVLALYASIGFLLGRLPFPLLVPGMMLIALVVLLNYRLYLFLVRRRGWAFALASMPFHFLYYLYSMLAFVWGAVIHFWNGKKWQRFRLDGVIPGDAAKLDK